MTNEKKETKAKKVEKVVKEKVKTMVKFCVERARLGGTTVEIGTGAFEDMKKIGFVKNSKGRDILLENTISLVGGIKADVRIQKKGWWAGNKIEVVGDAKDKKWKMVEKEAVSEVKGAPKQ